MIVKEKMTGIATKKNEVIGFFKSGTSYSSKFSFFEHLKEEIQIRIDNKQNILFVSLVFLLHYLKNIDKVDENNKFKLLLTSFFRIFKKKIN